jgi:hypothetical protein
MITSWKARVIEPWTRQMGALMKKNRNNPLVEEKKQPYRNIFDAANDGLIIIDLETGRE